VIISIPKEIFPGENRVACVPDVASKLIKAGYEVQIEKNAGLSAGFKDEQYEKAGAKIIENADQLYS
jgi:H+-translocating NAD(P) transhydrogenase subunit alpha